MRKCKCKAPRPEYEECKFMSARTGESAAIVHTTAFKAVCKSCYGLIGWYKNKPTESTHWTCCGVTRPIEQRCSCGEGADD